MVEGAPLEVSSRRRRRSIHRQPEGSAPSRCGPADRAGVVPPRPVSATVESSFTVSSCPWGQVVVSPAADIGRLTSNVSPQARQRNS